MRRLAVLLAGCCLASPATPRAASAAPDNKPAQHAADQQRKAMEQEIKRQQELEKKMMEQQRKAMQEQIKAEQKMMEQQQKAFQQQQKLMNQQQQKVAQAPHPGPVYHGSRPYYGHTQHNRTPYRHYRQMPTQVDPETLALHQLKKSLDSVKTGSTTTPAEKTAIKSALMRVVEVPKTPSVGSVSTLADHLAEGLAHRQVTGADTATMALTLRGAMNSTELPNIDLTEIMNEHRAALKAAKFQPTHVASIMDSLKSISNQERAHR